jgi:hypothetical protein
VFRDPTGRFSVSEAFAGLTGAQILLQLAIATVKAALLVCTASLIASGVVTATGSQLAPGICTISDPDEGGRRLYHYTDDPDSFLAFGARSFTWWTNRGDLTPDEAFFDLGIGPRPRPTHVVEVLADDRRFREGPVLPAGGRQWFNIVVIPSPELRVWPL